MKSFLLSSIFALILFCNTTEAQKSFKVTHLQTGKSRTFKFGDKLLIMPQGYDYFIKGTVQDVNETSISFYTPDESDVLLRDYKFSDLQAIKKATTLHRTGYVVGSILLLPGIYMLAESRPLADNSDGTSAWAFRGIGAGMLGLGILPFLIPAKTYHESEYRFSEK